jgi:hypothetical protein
MFISPKEPITSIEQVDQYISCFQIKSKNGRRGDRRIVNTASGCWEWIGAKSATEKEIMERRKVPYGRLNMDQALAEYLVIEGRTGKHIRPHVLIYHCYVEDLNHCWGQLGRNKVEIAHHCGNSLCCRPDHLYLTNRKQNARDRVRHRKEKDSDLERKLVELKWWRAKGKSLGVCYPFDE